MDDDPELVKARFDTFPKMPVVQLDRQTAVKLELLGTQRPPRAGHGWHKGLVVISGEGEQDGLIAIKADRETIEAIVDQLQGIAGRLRELDATLEHRPEGRGL